MSENDKETSLTFGELTYDNFMELLEILRNRECKETIDRVPVWKL